MSSVLKAFLSERQVRNNEKTITHVSMTGGKYSVPIEENKNFLELYLNTLKSNHPLYISECFIPGKLIKFVIDLEIRPEYREDDSTDEYVETFIIPSLIEELLKIIKERTSFDYTENKTSYILSKRAKYLAHINFPNLIINLNISKDIVNSLREKMLSIFPNIKWGKSLDTNIYFAGKGLRMLGSLSKKETKKNENAIYHVVDENYNYLDISLDHLELTGLRTELDDPESFVLTSHDESYRTDEEMSSTDSIISSYVDGIRGQFKENGISIHSIKKVISSESEYPCFAVSLEDRFCPFIKRSHKRESNPLYLWITKSGTVLKCYDEDCCSFHHPSVPIKLNSAIDKKYYNIVPEQEEKPIPEGYELTEEILDRIEDCFHNQSNHHDVANLVYIIYKDMFRVNNFEKSAKWYEFKNHRFHTNSNTLNILISEDMPIYFKKYKKIMCSGKNKNIDDLVIKLKTVSFKSNILSEAVNIFYHHHSDFIEKLDSNMNLICFNNGVLDLDSNEFRDGRVDDYISLTTHNDYIEYNPNIKEIKDIYKFLGSLFPDKEVMEYQIKKLSLCLHGKCQEEFNIWTGNGSNGKSKLCQLIQKTFGDYWSEAPVALFTKERNKASNASPEVMDLKGKRITTLQEPETKDRLNMGIVKHYTGNDWISARQLYGTQEKFLLQTKFFLSCNTVPKIDASDGGSWRRLKVVEFVSKFVNEPTRSHEFELDPFLEEKINKWGPYFISILIHYFSLYGKTKLKEPNAVKEFTREIRRDYDIFSQFVEQCLEDNRDKLTPFESIFSRFQFWCEEENVKSKLYTKTEIKKYLADIFGKEINEKNKNGFRLRLREQENELLL